MTVIGNKVGLRDIGVRGKRVLVRVDYNCPLKTITGDHKVVVADNSRIVANLPTIRYLLDEGAQSIVLMSHLGRPDGMVVPGLSMRPVAEELGHLLSRPIRFLEACVGTRVEEACAGPFDHQTEGIPIFVLENLRFHLEEEGTVKRKDGTKVTATPKDIAAFRRSLSRLGDVYVNDAFGAIHRAHSSIVGIDLPQRVAGFLVQKELAFFAPILEGPDRIDVAILGGAKVTDKIQLIRHLLRRVRHLVVGGAMPFTFLSVLYGMKIGNSLFDEKGATIVKDLMAEAKELGVTVHFPKDFVIGRAFSADTQVAQVGSIEEGIPDGWMGLDVGPKTAAQFKDLVLQSQSILWNGPVGAFELEPFAAGTKTVLEGLVEATQLHGATTVVGGGDSAAAVAKWGASHVLSHVSTGGGASLELLEGRQLPGIMSLCDGC